MPISVNPIFPVIAAEGAAPDMVLQPGTVINAQVLKILANDLVRIAIANLSIEVLSEIPLQVGQNLHLAVSQTPDGIRLAVVGQGRATGDGIPARGEDAAFPKPAAPDFITRSPDLSVSAAAKPERNAAEKSADAAAGACGVRGGADRSHAAGKPRAAICKSRRSVVSEPCRRNCNKRSCSCWRCARTSIRTSPPAT